jgi:hypothetical protein
VDLGLRLVAVNVGVFLDVFQLRRRCRRRQGGWFLVVSVLRERERQG